MTTIKLCKDAKGYMWATALPDGTENCENGPILGPPEGLRKTVHNRLAVAGIYNAFDLMGNRKVLLNILRELKIDLSYAKVVTHIYQMQYFEKEDES